MALAPSADRTAVLAQPIGQPFVNVVMSGISTMPERLALHVRQRVQADLPALVRGRSPPR